MADLDPLSLEFARRFPDSFARVLGRATAEDAALLIDRLPDSLKAGIVARLPAGRIARLLQSPGQSPVRWLSDAPFDDAVMLLSRMPRERRLELVNAVPDRKLRRQLLRSQQYPSHSVGALVRDLPLRIRADIRAEDALAELRELDTEDPGPLIIVDAGGHYMGMVDRWRLLMGNPPDGVIGDFSIDVAPLRPETPIEIAARSDAWNSRNWLPVVDHQRRVLGAVARARVLASLSRESGPGRLGSDVLANLLGNLAPVLGGVVETVLTGRDRT